MRPVSPTSTATKADVPSSFPRYVPAGAADRAEAEPTATVAKTAAAAVTPRAIVTRTRADIPRAELLSFVPVTCSGLLRCDEASVPGQRPGVFATRALCLIACARRVATRARDRRVSRCLTGPR